MKNLKLLTAASLLLFVMTLHGAPTLDIYWIDVEGGGGTLIVTPAKEAVLIDSGWPTGSAERIYRMATNAGVSKIDYLITTHFHVDHFGGAAALSKLMPIGTVLDNGFPDKFNEGTPPEAAEAYHDFKAEKRLVIEPRQLVPLKQTKGTGFLELRCVGARKTFPRLAKLGKTNPFCGTGKQMEVDTTDNANSIVLALQFGSFKFFDGGDLTWNMEENLVCPVNPIGAVDVYQTDHHGMDISNNPLLIAALTPTVSVMNNGANKGGSIGTLEHLRGVQSIQTMYQVHKDLRGVKEFNTEDKYIANLEEKCAGNFIKCSVDGYGKRYVMSIPGTGFSQGYKAVGR